MTLKFQSLIDTFNFNIGCPDNSAIEIDILAYRWVHEPVTHQLNFLPNIQYDAEQNVPPRVLEGDVACSRCGESFFITEDKAREKFTVYKTYLEKKHVRLIDRYTHLAIGQIRKKDGRAMPMKNDHFTFYEYSSCDFSKSFKILERPL